MVLLIIDYPVLGICWQESIMKHRKVANTRAHPDIHGVPCKIATGDVLIQRRSNCCNLLRQDGIQHQKPLPHLHIGYAISVPILDTAELVLSAIEFTMHGRKAQHYGA